ncbi:hypothetical protein J4410_01510 [Candidatus Woesearchaeota archaeon]|nr:hypothetical protein [Candidatus Woesearchaeota archaeon]
MFNLITFPESKAFPSPLKEVPSFATYQEDLHILQKTVQPFQKYKKIILLAHGGSRTSSYAFYHTFPKKKDIFFLSTNDPLTLRKVQKDYTKEDSLLVVISKSGTTRTILESLLFFKGYTTLVITEKNTPLYEVAKKQNWTWIEHPPIGGRFSAFTSSGLAPALLMGINVDKLCAGAQEVYNQCRKEENSALKAASFLFLYEQKGYTEVFLPLYSFASLLPLIIQLMHESICKEGKGQTFFGDEAPEFQHHTNQRCFGGRKNAVGFFLTRKKEQIPEKIQVPEDFKNMPLQQHTFAHLDGIRYEDAFSAEWKGLWEDAKQKKIPLLHLELDGINEQSLGACIAFWQYVAVYGALLRGLNPYDQPQVEASKILSTKEREKYK